jgi:hypothetical protein
VCRGPPLLRDQPLCRLPRLPPRLQGRGHQLHPGCYRNRGPALVSPPASPPASFQSFLCLPVRRYSWGRPAVVGACLQNVRCMTDDVHDAPVSASPTPLSEATPGHVEKVPEMPNVSHMLLLLLESTEWPFSPMDSCRHLHHCCNELGFKGAAKPEGPARVSRRWLTAGCKGS